MPLKFQQKKAENTLLREQAARSAVLRFSRSRAKPSHFRSQLREPGGSTGFALVFHGILHAGHRECFVLCLWGV